MNCGKPVEETIYSSEMENNLRKYLLTGSLALGMNLNNKNVNFLISYLKMIQHYQKITNITALTDAFNIIEKHFLDSFLCINLLHKMIEAYGKKESIKMIDIGSGAGFPGVPVKILFPEVSMLLLEARKNKKIFLDEVVASLALKNTNVVQGRAENLGAEKGHREGYHAVLSRAVAPLSVLCEYCLPLCRMTGAMIAFKGTSYYQELSLNYQVIKKLGGSLESVNLFKVPPSNYLRSILFIRKIAPTPEKYPRKNGIPLKRPLSF